MKIHLIYHVSDLCWVLNSQEFIVIHDEGRGEKTYNARN